MGAYTEGMGDALAERLLGVAEGGVSENAIERALEDRAEEELAACSRPFTDWLDDYPEHARSIAVAVCGFPDFRRPDGQWLTLEECRQQRLSNIFAARIAAERAYIAYRTGTASEAERDEIADSIRADRREA